MTGHLPIDVYNRGKPWNWNADWGWMADLDSHMILTLNSRGGIGPAEKVGDLRLSFFGYYYF
jgi:hypothetical protein